jgi:hypothetical protein
MTATRSSWFLAIVMIVAVMQGRPASAVEDEDFRAELAEISSSATSLTGKASTASTQSQRLQLLRSALTELDRLDALASNQAGLTSDQSKWAAEATAQLASAGVDRDGLARRAASAALGILDQATGRGERIEAVAIVDEMIGTMKRGLNRAALAAEAGLQLNEKGFSERSERMLLIALSDMRADASSSRADVAQKAAELILRLAPPSAAELVVDALSVVDGAAQRSSVLADAARKAASSKTGKNVGGNLAQIVSLILASKPAAARDADLRALFDMLLTRNAPQDAIVAALAVSNEQLQAGALNSIVVHFLSAELPLRALTVAALVPSAALRLEALLSVADALSRSGYRAAAAQTAAQAVAAYNINPAAPDAARNYIRIAVLLARGDYFANAQRMAERLRDPVREAPIWSAIAIRHAENGNQADADATLGKVSGAAARAAAINSFAASKVERGDLGAAFTLLNAMDGGSLEFRVARDFALAAVRDGRVDAADGIVTKLKGADAAILRTVVALAKDRDGTMRQGLQAGLAQLDAADKERLLVEAVAVLSASGATEAARGLAGGIKTPALLAIAEDSILVGDAAGTKLKDGLRAIRDLPDWRRRVSLFRSVALDLSLKLDAYKVLSAGLGMRGLPVAGAVGPTEFSPTERMSDDRMTVSQGEGNFSLGEIPQWPKLSTRAAHLRAMAPMATGGTGGLAAARSSRFLEKFFEESLGVSAGSVLIEAQRSINPVFIELTKGVFGIAELRRLLGAQADRYLPVKGDTATLRIPIVVGPEATLVLSGLESPKIHLSSTEGAFLVNVGKLFILDTELVAFDEKKQQPAHAHYADKTKFRPFIVSWSDSEFYLAGSRVISLGYNAGKAYGLALTSGPKSIVSIRDNEKPPLGIMAENSIENCLYGFYSYEADDAVLIGNEYRNNIVYGVDPHDRSKRLLIAFNTAYGSEEKHGIIVSREVNDGAIVGNVTFENKGSGFMLDRSSTGNLVYANTGVMNVQDGLTLFESACTLILNNAMIDNDRSGIKIRNSYDVAVIDNVVARNVKAGIEGYIAKLEGAPGSELRDFELDPYQPVTTFVVTGNVVDSNRIGISAKGVSGVALGLNQLRRQTPRLFGGNIDQWRVRVLSYIDEGSMTVLASTCLPKRPEHACSLLSRKVMPSAVFDRFYSEQGSTSYCVNKTGTVQNISFGPDPDHTADEE